MSETTLIPTGERPGSFSNGGVEWRPWLEPVPVDGTDAAQTAALKLPFRTQTPYRRVLARDPGILHSRTLLDNDIFYNFRTGLPRADREFAAAAVSRVNACVLCASVHARLASTYSKRPEDVQVLLEGGVSAPQQNPRWQAIQTAAAALTATPTGFGPDDVAALAAAGLDDLEIADALHASAFFNWANRLMLSLGEPVVSDKAGDDAGAKKPGAAG